MAWFERLTNIFPEQPSGIPKYSTIGEYVRNIIDSKTTIYHDSEAFEVTRVVLNRSSFHGAVIGTFINNPNQEVKCKDDLNFVLPLTPHITTIPVVGEHVAVIEYNGQHFYTSIINRKDSVNENSMPGTAKEYESGTKYGKTFERNIDIKHVKCQEGDVLFEGRFGNSINLSSNPKNQAPNIKIRAGQGKPAYERYPNTNAFAEESIVRDGASIYLTTDETIKFPSIKPKGSKLRILPKRLKGNSIALNADRLLLNARTNEISLRAAGNITLEASRVTISSYKTGTIFLGNPQSKFIPTLNPEKIHELMTDLMITVSDGFAAIGKATNPVGLVDAAKDIAKIVAERVPNIIDIVKNERYYNKEIMIALPGFQIPRNKTGDYDKNSKTLLDDNEDGFRTDGKFDSENFEKESTRTADGKRDAGPRRY
tara:strand:- start:3036 stop:4313 length:1278 start_codon:yes stop_codon:yes gene_type:complete